MDLHDALALYGNETALQDHIAGARPSEPVSVVIGAPLTERAAARRLILEHIAAERAARDQATATAEGGLPSARAMIAAARQELARLIRALPGLHNFNLPGLATPQLGAIVERHSARPELVAAMDEVLAAEAAEHAIIGEINRATHRWSSDAAVLEMRLEQNPGPMADQAARQPRGDAAA